MSKNVIAMVPVRAGSTRVPNKNIRPFGSTNLLQLKLKLLKEVVGISQIVVSTDCETSADVAFKERRPDINGDFLGIYPWDWVRDDEASFKALTGGLLVAPILQTLILNWKEMGN